MTNLNFNANKTFYKTTTLLKHAQPFTHTEFSLVIAVSWKLLSSELQFHPREATIHPFITNHSHIPHCSRHTPTHLASNGPGAWTTSMVYGYYWAHQHSSSSYSSSSSSSLCCSEASTQSWGDADEAATHLELSSLTDEMKSFIPNWDTHH